MKELLTEKQYEAAISRIEELYKLTDEHTPVNDPMMVELDHLGQLVEQYEDIHYPIGKPSFPGCHQTETGRNGAVSEETG